MEPSSPHPDQPTTNLGEIAALVATKTASANIPAQLLFLPGQYLLVTREHQTVTYKLLSPTDVVTAFSQEPIDSGWLPPNTVRWGHSYAGSWLVQFYPPQLYRLVIQYRCETVALKVPMPAFVFQGCGHSYQLWAVDCAQFTPDCQLFRPPLPNVGERSAICFGANSPPISSPRGIVKAWELFWRSAFNSHNVALKSKSYPEDVRSLLCELYAQQASVFPSAELIPIPGQTLSQLLPLD